MQKKNTYKPENKKKTGDSVDSFRLFVLCRTSQEMHHKKIKKNEPKQKKLKQTKRKEIKPKEKKIGKN